MYGSKGKPSWGGRRKAKIKRVIATIKKPKGKVNKVDAIINRPTAKLKKFKK